MRVLITGGAGFIGAHLAKRLYLNHYVRILDTLSRNALKNTDLNVEVIQGDVCNPRDVAMAMDGMTHIVHMAAIVGVDNVLRQPSNTMKVALIGTYNVLEECKKHPIERFIDFSTSEVFGNFAYKLNEGSATSLGAVGEARWTYAVSKLTTEHWAHTYFEDFDVQTCSIRPFNVFGPNQVGDGAVRTFIKQAIQNKPLFINNDGDQIRSWCYVDDIIDGIMLCLTKLEAIGESFNLGNPRNTLTIYQLAKEITRLSNSKSPIIFRKKEEKDVELRVPDISKAKALLGFLPKVDLDEGLLNTLTWYISNPP